MPIIRTSVDHGTAYGRAGEGRAREDSLDLAIEVAAQMSRAKMAAASRLASGGGLRPGSRFRGNAQAESGPRSSGRSGMLNLYSSRVAHPGTPLVALCKS